MSRDLSHEVPLPTDEPPREAQLFQLFESFQVQEILEGTRKVADRNFVRPDEGERRGLLHFVDTQHAKALSMAKRFEIDPKPGDAPIPSASAIEQAVLRSVTAEQWQEIERFSEPTLLLVPHPIRRSRLEQGANTPFFKVLQDVRRPSLGALADEKRNIYFYPLALEYFRRLEEESSSGLSVQDKDRFDAGQVLGWNFVITDAAVDMTDQGVEWNQETSRTGSSVPTNRERLAAFTAHFTPKNMTGLDGFSYIVLQMGRIEGLRQMDDKTYTLFPEIRGEPLGVGHWNSQYCRIHLGYNELDSRSPNMRLRPAVTGGTEL